MSCPVGPIFLWCHETWRQQFETGIQRVVRRVARALAELGFEAVPVGWDRRTLRIEALEPNAARGRQALHDASSGGHEASWLLVLEIDLGLAAMDLDPVQIGHAYGFRVAALVHDLIPMKLADDYPEVFRTLFRRYVAMFAAADLVLTTTDMVAGDLLAQLQIMGRSVCAPPVTIWLPAQFADRQRVQSAKAARAAGAPLRLLTVSTWEPRKNLPRLLRAIRQAQANAGLAIHLTIVGGRGVFLDYDATVDAILAEMPNVTTCGRIDDEALADLYANSDATVYPSIEEGFGLPIGESLWFGTPCVCHNGSSMAEIAPGGGALPIDMMDVDAIAAQIVRLAEDPGRLALASAEAMARPLTSWRDYAGAIASTLRNALPAAPP